MVEAKGREATIGVGVGVGIGVGVTPLGVGVGVQVRQSPLTNTGIFDLVVVPFPSPP